MGKDRSKNTRFFSRCRCSEIRELQLQVDDLNAVLEVLIGLKELDTEMVQQGESVVSNCQSVFDMEEELRLNLNCAFSNLSQDVVDKQTAVKTKVEEKIQELQDRTVQYQVEDDDYHNSLIIIKPIKTSLF